MRLAVVIGTSHKYQIGGTATTAEQNSDFRVLIEEVCIKHDIQLICEEMNIEALKYHEIDHSTLKIIAEHMCLLHAYCEPSIKEQVDAGITTERNEQYLQHIDGMSAEVLQRLITEEHRWREKWWVEFILTRDIWPTLLVCGSEHSSQVSRLLKSHGIQVNLVSEKWGE